MNKSRIFKVLFFVLVVGGGLVGAFTWLSITINNSRFPPSSRVQRGMVDVRMHLQSHHEKHRSFPPYKWVVREDGSRHPAPAPFGSVDETGWKSIDWHAKWDKEAPLFGYVVATDHAILVSVGPDQDFDTRWTQINLSLSAKDQARALSPITYDPTNGTKSSGDVYLIVEPTLVKDAKTKAVP